MNISNSSSSDPLPSWNDGSVKTAILDFVEQITTEGTAEYLPPQERIATFDNDGTLWCERPFQVQAYFLLDRVKSIAAEKREFAEQQPFKALLEQDKATMATFGKQELITLFFATHTGMTLEEFQAIAVSWLNS